MHLNPLVCQSNPPEHVASTSDQSDSFQPEASFSFTVGRKQLDTIKTQVRWESWRQPTHDGPKDKIEHTYSSFCTHKAARWVIIAAKINKRQEWYVQIQTFKRPSADAKIVSLLKGWSMICWPHFEKTSIFVINRNSQPVVEQLWGSVRFLLCSPLDGL